MRSTTYTLLAVSAASLAACGGNAGGHAPASATIAIRGFKFDSAVTTVRAGGRVTFVDRDRAEHTATGGAFDTGALHRGASKTVALRRPGTYTYRCDFHPFMTGEVVVVK